MSRGARCLGAARIICMRKFSLKYTDAAFASRLPSEMTWLLAEIGMVLNKLVDLVEAFTRLPLENAQAVSPAIQGIEE